jgi:hypothetical protein
MGRDSTCGRRREAASETHVTLGQLPGKDKEMNGGMKVGGKESSK